MWGPHVSGLTVFGTSKPYGHISGAATYNAATGLWTVTGAATVDISPETGAAVLMARRIVVDGGVLTVPTKCKGLHLYASAGLQMLNGGRIHVDKLGKAGNFGNLTPLDLLPAVCRAVVNRRHLASWVILGSGALGAAGATANDGPGKPGIAAGAMQLGGGGSGSGVSGKGGKAGPCCGGAGSGAGYGTATSNAGDYGGPGSAAINSTASPSELSGGAGDPGGLGTHVGGSYTDPVPAPQGGGLLMLFAPIISIASGCIVSADGSPSTPTLRTGGSAGGGCILAVTRPSGLQNLGTMRAAGGVSVAGSYKGGNGGAGSVNTFTA